MILSFLITAWFTFAVALVAFLFVDHPAPEEELARLDHLVIKLARKPFSSHGKLSWSPGRNLMQQVCLMLGDQQLVAGGSILVVCFSTHVELTQYHFMIGASLAFASFATFQTIVLVAAEVLRASAVRETWRFCWMLFIGVTVIVSNFVFEDQHFLEPDKWGAPMQCVWDNLGTYDLESTGLLVFWTVICVGAILSMAAFLWPSPRFLNWCIRFQSFPPSALLLAISWVDKTFLRSTYAKSWRLIGFVLQIPLLCTFWIAFTVFEVYNSASFNLFGTYLILFTTTQDLYQIRKEALDKYLTGDEDKWSFGQILPLLLLALPVFGAVELFFGESLHQKR